MDFIQQFMNLLNPSDASQASASSPMNATNTTTPHFELPITVLESIVPGYGLIRKVVVELFGIDISIVVSILGFLFVLRTAFTYSYDFFTNLLYDYFTVSIDMAENDDPFEPLMRWIVANGHVNRQARSLRAAGRWWDRMLESPKSLLEVTEQQFAHLPTNTAIFNYETLEAKKPLGFEPAEGNYRFWHNRRLYHLNWYIKTYTHRYDEVVRVGLSTYGWSTQPLKQLLEECRAADRTEEEATTDFYRADPHDSDWRCVATRPSRPMNTVALDTSEKLRLVRDVNDFIHPTRAKWYSNRGIPYRRGYLFSGPPGTGKTSLSLALAGVFGLGLYALSLQDSKMSEERLTQLFDYLPERCVVLLEDIDSAGIDRRVAGTAGTTAGAVMQKAGPDREESSTEDAKAGPKKNEPKKESGISLAGLLNCIDGVASHEGHVLIMTTNHPEKLDAALKRPGRVDLEIRFSLATRFQAREIFLRMFTDEVEPRSKQGNSSDEMHEGTDGGKRKSAGTEIQTVEDVCRERSELADSRTCPFMSVGELDDLADEFVSQLPEKTFSPAEIQGYLLLYKSDPVVAVKWFAKWMGDMKPDLSSEGLGLGGSGIVKTKADDDDEGSGVEVEAEKVDAVTEGGEKEKK